MSSFFMLATLFAYFFLLLYISRRSSRRGARGNEAFFRAGRQSPWWLVAFGMIGASISGVTFISVPGWAQATGMTYLQMCLGFIVGYVIVAFVLLPLYYKWQLTSIYAWLGERFGRRTHRTGALFFLLSKLTGAAARLYLVCLVLCQFVVYPLLGSGWLPFMLTAIGMLFLIWLYTRQSGIQTIVRTDALQTACLLFSALGICVIAAHRLDLGFLDTFCFIAESPLCRMWEFDPASKQAFWRQFLSGIFIVIVMTGLDQDMMQKNLTCRNLQEAQKDMCVYGLTFLPVNALFLGLGILLYAFCAAEGITPPAASDELLPSLVSAGVLGHWVIIPFTIGIVAAAFSSADSALTALTTTVCIDLLQIERGDLSEASARRIRHRVHLCMVGCFVLCMVLFRLANNTSVLDAIYVMGSYTYGPLLGLYAYGIFTCRSVTDTFVPFVCLFAPVFCAALDYFAPRLWGYTFGYELLLLNGMLTFAGLWITSVRRSSDEALRVAH